MPSETKPKRRLRVGGALCAVSLLVSAVALTAAPLEDYFTRQTQVNKELATEHYNLAMWCEEQKLYSEARRELERVLALDPTHAAAARKLGELTKLIRRTKDLKCEIHLVNGDRMKATLLMGDFKVQTPSGFLMVPAAAIQIIHLGPGPKPDHIISDAYVGEVHIRAETFAAKSKVGTITVKRQDVKSIRILRPCEGCDEKGHVKCRRCGGTGRLNERSVCPDCDAKGFTKCETCNGKATMTCPLCGGRGRFRGAWGRLRRVSCPRCAGTGRVECPDCAGQGRIECATCQGKPITTKAGVCPVCTGKKVTTCKVCGGTGIKPLPKDDAEGSETPEE